MKALLVCIAVIIGQMNTLQDRQIVHLQLHSGAIRTDFGGKLLELLNAPTIIYLPMAPPKLDSQGIHGPSTSEIWDPGAVTVVGTSEYSSRIIVGQTLHIFSNG